MPNTFAKRSFCAAVVVVAASPFLPEPSVFWARFDASNPSRTDVRDITLLLTAVLSGSFVLTRFIADSLGIKAPFNSVGKFLKAVLGFAICTLICGSLSQYAQAVHDIVVSNYDEKYGSSFGGDLVSVIILTATIGLFFTSPFWILGGLVSQAVWPLLIRFPNLVARLRKNDARSST